MMKIGETHITLNGAMEQRRCVDLTYNSCRNSIKKYDNASYYYDHYNDLMRACPKSCGLCK